MAIVDDKVWFDDARKLQQICYEVQVSSAAGQRVLVLAHFALTLAAVEARLRQSPITFERFSSFNFSELCENSPFADRPRVWLGLARSFQPPSARASQPGTAPPIKVIVVEHHPRESRDREIVAATEKLTCEAQLGFHISLDDPLLKHFAGASLRPLLEKLGLDQNESISHPLVTSAIHRAQEKIESTVQRDLQTESIDDWFRFNLPEKAM